MNRRMIMTAISLIWLSQWSAGCKGHSNDHAYGGVNKLVAVMHPTAGHSVQGVVWFVKVSGQVKVIADVEGLSPGANHAIHIHEFGDATMDNGKSAGGHYNPEGHPHALPTQPKRHAGDLGNLQADASGRAHYEQTVNNITLTGHTNPIIGRGVIIHAKNDDGNQPTGNAGPRIAVGVIGIAKP